MKPARCDFLRFSATRWELPGPQNKAACRGHRHPQVRACRGVARGLGETVASEGPCHLGALALSLSGGAWRRVCAPRQCWSLFSCVSRKGVQSAQWGGQAPVSISPRLPWASARTSPGHMVQLVTHIRLWIRLCAATKRHPDLALCGFLAQGLGQPRRHEPRGLVLGAERGSLVCPQPAPWSPERARAEDTCHVPARAGASEPTGACDLETQGQQEESQNQGVQNLSRSVLRIKKQLWFLLVSHLKTEMNCRPSFQTSNFTHQITFLGSTEGRSFLAHLPLHTSLHLHERT